MSTRTYGNRKTDDLKDGWKKKLLLFQEKWGSTISLVTGVVAVCAAIGLIVLATFYRASENDRTQRNEEAAKAAVVAARQAKVSCRRSRTFGPPLADAYARYKILTPKQVAAYRLTIPTSC